MMQQIYILTIFLISLTSAALAQNNFTAQPLPKTVNSEYNDFNPVISPDGKIIYFTRASHPENSHNPRKAFGPADSEDIWFSNYQKDGTWSTAERLPAPFNTGVYNGLHSISEDGEIFLINGVYDKKNRWIKRGLSVCTKADNGWTNPVELKVVGKLKKNKGIASNAFMTTDEQLLFLSYANNFGGKKQNLYVSINNGDYFSKPIKLPKTVNTKKYKEEAPFYDSALQRLYFSSNRENAAKGKDGMNIYYTQPSDKTFTSWSAPTRFSGTEGSATWESYYKLNHKGSWAYFASDKNSPGAADIYRIKIFEENPFVEVSGQVRDIATNLALPSKYKFKILANNTEVDSIKINPDDATFVMKLPLGKKYILQADSKNHVAILDTIDATGHKEFFEVPKNLFVKSFPYVVLTGKIMDMQTKNPLPFGSEPKIQVNGKDIPFDEIDNNTGQYKIHVKYGMKHTISVFTKGFLPDPQPMDLSNIHEYQEIETDLFVQKYVATDPTEAVITGIIYDKKTGKPLSTDKIFTIYANEIAAKEIIINSKTASYKMNLPLGKSYVINASSQGYYPVYEQIDLTGKTESFNLTKDLTIAPIEVGMSIKLNNIFFETGKAALKKTSFPELDRVVKFLKENDQIKIELAGHTDNVGNAASNLTLSDKRAASVLKYISGKGISTERLVSKGYGMTKPVASNKTKAGKTQNRRVEFTILEK